jgi:hypothetical protein
MRLHRPAGYTSYTGAVQAATWMVVFFFMLYLTAVRVGWHYAFTRVPLVIVCHIVNFYVCYSWLMPRYYERKKYLPAFGGLFLLLLCLTPIRFAIERYLESRPGAPVIPVLRVAGSRGLRVFILFSELLIAFFAALLRLSVSHQANKKRLAEMERLQLETELRFLKAQTSPHFLFNTINNIYALTLARSDEAPASLMKLSALLRYLLYECQEKVSLQRELEALTSYADLFRLRYQQPVDLLIQHQLADKELRIEPMLLLPLLENAVKHSGLGIDVGAYARMEIRQEGAGIGVLVVNSKTLVPLAADSGGIGVHNICKRLEILYPGAHTFTIEETGAIFSVALKIPLA